MATTHRCILRFLTQLGFEVFSIATTLSIARKTGPSLSFEVFLVSECRTISKKTAFLFFHSFFNTSPSSGKSLRACSREKERVELNQTALPVGDIYSDLHADLALTGAINVRSFFFWNLLPNLSFGGDFQCIHV